MMKLKRIPAIEGKTIQTAEQGGGDYTGEDNRTLQLTFTDGSSFCISVGAKMRAEGVLYSSAEDEDGKNIYKR